MLRVRNEESQTIRVEVEALDPHGPGVFKWIETEGTRVSETERTKVETLSALLWWVIGWGTRETKMTVIVSPSSEASVLTDTKWPLRVRVWQGEREVRAVVDLEDDTKVRWQEGAILRSDS